MKISSKIKSASELKKEVYKFALQDGRMPGTHGHEKAKEYILSRMRSMGLAPYTGNSFELPYSHSDEDFTNIIGTVKSNFPKKPPLLIGAHYDTVIPAECADDNAAAVVIALAAGEYFMSLQDELERDVIIAIFDAEEPPHFHNEEMGSEYFYQHQKDERGFHAAFIMDLVGHDILIPSEFYPPLHNMIRKMPLCGNRKDFKLPMLKDLFFVTGAESAPEMPMLFSEVGKAKGLRVVNTLNHYIGDMSDHGAFRRDGVPFLFFSCGRWAHYHQESDTPEKLNYHKMAKILKYLINLSVQAVKTELSHGQSDPSISTTLEAESLKKATAPFTPILLKYLGMESVTTRDDIDFIAEILTSTGL